MLTIAQKSSVRRHLGYPIVGLASQNPNGGSLYDGSVGYRWNQSYAFLEYKLTAGLNPDEEARITGNAFGAILLNGTTQTGDAVTMTVSGGPLVSPVALTYTAGSSDTSFTMAVGLANLVNQNATLATNGFFAMAPYGGGPYSYRPGLQPVPEMAIQNPVAFILAVSSSGATSAAITANGALLHPEAVLSDPLTNTRTRYWGYLSILNALETAIGSASDDLDTLKADVWTARADEVQQREQLYHNWRRRLSLFLDVPLWEDVPNSHYTGSRAFDGAFI